jgi:hypothetical protein
MKVVHIHSVTLIEHIDYADVIPGAEKMKMSNYGSCPWGTHSP